MNIVLFNNEIYGLTKGQFSPTSKKGIKTKSNPHGTIDEPFSPSDLAIGSKCSFFARVVDTNPKLMQTTFIQAEEHRGTSLIEILQNCVIFNDKTFASITKKDVKNDGYDYEDFYDYSNEKSSHDENVDNKSVLIPLNNTIEFSKLNGKSIQFLGNI